MDQQDHDLLISLNTKMTTICNQQTELSKDFKSFKNNCDECEEKIYTSIGDVDKKKVDFNIFKWIIGGVCVVVLIITGYLVIAGTQITKNTTEIKHLNHSHQVVAEQPKS